mmetsp:Transcript_102897/g.286565  ORF Transcript_102897/g.286565 Transcript_102897/m.286565 type:complete len:456 (-) Transcript_102897:155-1522(-)|eukprot:CAMPEP_0179122720 /NCGR_PEP_ID=MMETSP0796-20121207/57928_1 /TAXON_ID=73915 /ORGANISM="Pyrodinium bahamense, Strain pbaha01" /LENGTH=455 /DNA_ID=CAMNT_0020821345 /DNA_START=82 /DNA_END=1449 /DNA_ORIENTATION=-
MVHPLVVAMATGMGLLTDKYMLAVTNFVEDLAHDFHATDFQKEFVKAAMYGGAVLGMVTFGPLSDYVGRRVCLIACSVITLIGAVGSMCAFSETFLIFCRIITGVGMGGEYPLAATHSAESGDTDNGGRNVALLYLFGSGFGQASCPLIVYILLKVLGEGHDEFVWRATFGVGAFFALTGLILRVMVTKDSAKFKEAKEAREEGDIPPWAALAAAPLAGTAFCWFLYDVVEYGLKQNDASIFKKAGEGEPYSKSVLAVFFSRLLVIPSLVAASFMPKMFAIKWMQLAGFAGCAAINFILMLKYDELKHGSELLFGALYVIQLSFQSLPGVTTMAVPAEIFPAAYKGTAHGVSAAMGKVGATVGSYFFANLAHHGNFSGIFGVVFGTSLFAALLTMGLTPNYNGNTLDKMEQLARAGQESRAVKMLYSGPQKSKVFRTGEQDDEDSNSDDEDESEE